MSLAVEVAVSCELKLVNQKWGAPGGLTAEAHQQMLGTKHPGPAVRLALRTSHYSDCVI